MTGQEHARTPLDPAAVARRIEAELRARATPERAEGEKRYLKSQLTHLGATVWDIRRTVKGVARTHPSLTHDELVALVAALWAEPVHERRMAAASLLDRFHRLLTSADLTLVESLVRESRTWALVDVLAGDVTGAVLVAYPEAARVLDKWAADPDFWVRRAALLAWLLPLREGAPFDSFAAHADAMLEEKEFFIRKAIGWVLRDAGKRRPDEVAVWLAPRTHRASGVTIREAVKYLPAERAAALMEAYRAKRPLS